MLKIFWSEVSELDPFEISSLFSSYRLCRLEKIKPVEKRKQSIGAELLLIRAIKSVFPDAQLPFDIACNNEGKPVLKNFDLHFSLSHSGKYAACAISDSCVGLDIEYKPKIREKVVEHYFTDAEKNFVELSEDKDKKFAQIWTGKESAVKFLGTGIGKGIDTVEILDSSVAVIKEFNTRLPLIQIYDDGLFITACTAQLQTELEIENIKL